jgi:hypothetical protein
MTEGGLNLKPTGRQQGAAREAGLCDWQRKTALRINNIPRDQER